MPDCWLKYGNIWEVWKPHHAVNVKFGGYVDGYVNEKVNLLPIITQILLYVRFHMMNQLLVTIQKL